MKKLFFYLLKKYSKTEEQRLYIHEFLNQQVRNEYTEQSGYGNIYNSNIEFIMANDLIRSLVEENKTKELEMIKEGLAISTEEAIKFIKNEPRRKKLLWLDKLSKKNPITSHHLYIYYNIQISYHLFHKMILY